MIAEKLLALSVFAWSLTYLAVAARLTRVPRAFVHSLLPRWARGPLECAPCAATWIGAGLGAARLFPAELYGRLPGAGLAADIVCGALWAMATLGIYQGVTGRTMADLAPIGRQDGN